MHGRLKPLNDLTRRHSSGKNRPGAVHGSSQHSVTNTSNISAQARQFRPRRVHKLGLTNAALLTMTHSNPFVTVATRPTVPEHEIRTSPVSGLHLCRILQYSELSK